MPGPNDGEVTAIEGRDGRHVEPLGRGDHRRVNRSERKVRVLGHQFGDAQPVDWIDVERRQVPGREIAEELDLGGRTQARREQVSDLGDHQDRDQDRSRVISEEAQRRGMMGIVCVDIGVERAGVGEQAAQPSSSRRISSIRSETS